MACEQRNGPVLSQRSHSPSTVCRKRSSMRLDISKQGARVLRRVAEQPVAADGAGAPPMSLGVRRATARSGGR